MPAKLSRWENFIGPIIRHFRQQRGKKILQIFPDLFSMSIADVGGSRHFWQENGLEEAASRVTIFNIGEGDSGSLVNQGDVGMPIVLYDGRDIPVANHQYDLVICNSVLEHIPIKERASFVKEIRRIGRRFIVQTPAYGFPVEPHFILPFIHWLPRRLGYWLVYISPWFLLSRPSHHIHISYWWGTSLLGRSELSSLFPDCEIHTERFLGLAKSYMVIGEDVS